MADEQRLGTISSRFTPSAEAVDTIAKMLGRGASVSAIGEALAISRNSVSGIIFRFRKANDARFKPAGTSAVLNRPQRMALLADAWADGALNQEDAAKTAGMTLQAARSMWSEICAKLGHQAR